jgi:hypothetical protein
MLLGEPSPALAAINGMNMVKLEAKIKQLRETAAPLVIKLEKLKAKEPLDEQEIAATEALLARLKALEAAAQERYNGKAQRKAERERRGLR